MPDRGRHARSKWEWGTPPPRSQERAAAAQDDPVRKKAPAKKDPDLCKGRHWKGPHTPEPELTCHPQTGQPGDCAWKGRYWGSDEDYHWACSHVLKCPGCGKDFGRASPGQCPRFREITPSERSRIDAENAESAARQAKWRWARRKVIDGPQGYRKKKEKK